MMQQNMNDSNLPSRSISQGRVLVGIAGWSYPDWKGLVYPRESNFDKLRYLAQYFDVIEVNTSFYAIPSSKTVEKWLRSVSDKPEFVFTLKAHKEFTHGSAIRDGKPVIQPESVALLKDAIRPMLEARKLGALLLQFPYRFRNESKNRQHLLELLETFREYPLVVEVRHNSFDDPSFFQMLQDWQVAFANIDQPAISDSLPPTKVFTSSEIAYLRFHGRKAATWFVAKAGRDVRYDYHYSPEELETYEEMIQEFRHRQGTLYVIFNNHYRGAEVRNALEFLHQITGQQVRVMPPLLKAFPELQKIASPANLEESEIQPGENYRLFD
jgi:uncharacterized protein YecE (DUF72 family)